MTNDLKKFYDQLTSEEVILASDVAVDNLGVVMRAGINELDLAYDIINQINPITEADYERMYIMRIGVIRLIKLAMQAHPHFDAPLCYVPTLAKAFRISAFPNSSNRHH